MAVPKKKTSKSRRNMRRSHHALDGVMVVENSTTGELMMPHNISVDGYYKGRLVIVKHPRRNAANDETAAETL